MAYLAATALNEYRAQYAGSNLDKQENRGSGYGLLSLAKRDTPNLISPAEIVKARGNSVRATKIPVLQKISFTPGSVRTCTPETKYTTSALVTITWVTLFNGFHMIPSQYENQEIRYIEDFKHKLNQMEMQWAKTIEAAIYTKLDAVKSTTFTADTAPFDFTANVIQIPAAYQKTYLDELYASLMQDDFTPPFNIVGSPGLLPINNFYSNQGQNNAQNTIYQFGDYNFDYSNRVTKSTGVRATCFVMPVGSLGMLTWVDPDARRKAKIAEGNYWDTFTMPTLGFDVGMHVLMACGDNATETGGVGLEASVTENFMFSVDYAFVTPYISAGAAPIYKADLLMT